MHTPILAPTAMPIWEVWERPFDDVWLVEVADGIAIDEDARFNEDEAPSAFVGLCVIDHAAWVDGEDVADVFSRLLAVLDVPEEVIETDDEPAVVFAVFDIAEAVAELVVSSLSSKVVWNAITGGVVVAWQL
jgi:hypothetical protein